LHCNEFEYCTLYQYIVYLEQESFYVNGLRHLKWSDLIFTLVYEKNIVNLGQPVSYIYQVCQIILVNNKGWWIFKPII